MAKNEPLLTIGLPVYNGEDFIKEAINSILNQTFKDFELIISDNASTDKTEKICEGYAKKDKRVRYYRNKENLGAAENYNVIVKLARGEYFKWASHDDICAPTFFKKCVEALESNPKSILAYPKTITINEKGEFVEKYDKSLESINSPLLIERFKNLFPKSNSKSLLHICYPVFGVIRTSALRKTRLIGKFNSSDRITLTELALLGKFTEIPDYLYYKRFHKKMSTRAQKWGSKEMAAWFDTKKGKYVPFVKARLFLEYIKSVNRVPIPLNTKIKCYRIITRYLIRERKALIEEFKYTLKSNIILSLKRIS